MEDTKTRAAMEALRRLAVAKVADGWAQKDVAAFLGVHPVTVNKWVRAHRAGGEDALTGTPHPGRTPFLTPRQEAKVVGWLAERPTAHGFPTDLWTARRVAELIRTRLGVAFHPGYLRERLARRGYSPQKPATRARERNLDAVAGWLRDQWPDVLKKRAARTPASS